MDVVAETAERSWKEKTLVLRILRGTGFHTFGTAWRETVCFSGRTLKRTLKLTIYTEYNVLRLLLSNYLFSKFL